MATETTAVGAAAAVMTPTSAASRRPSKIAAGITSKGDRISFTADTPSTSFLFLAMDLRVSDAPTSTMAKGVAALPRAFGALIATHALPLILVLAFLFVPGWLNWLTPIVLLFFGLFGLSFNKLIAASYANALCEKYLNTKIDGARVGIGLRSASETKLD